MELTRLPAIGQSNNQPDGYIYVQPSRELNAVETNIMGVRHGETLEVLTPYWTNIDTDNFGRLVGIEILAPGDMKDDLRKYEGG